MTGLIIQTADGGRARLSVLYTQDWSCPFYFIVNWALLACNVGVYSSLEKTSGEQQPASSPCCF